jgi:hypothetical protein
MKELGHQSMSKAAGEINTPVALANVKKLGEFVRDIKLAHHHHNAYLDYRERVYTQRKRIVSKVK